AGFVGHKARGKDESRFLAVQIGERALELDQRAVGARDIAGATGANAHRTGGVLHGLHDFFVLAHAQIVIRAPDVDFARIVRVVTIDGARKTSGDAFEVGKYAIALF